MAGQFNLAELIATGPQRQMQTVLQASQLRDVARQQQVRQGVSDLFAGNQNPSQQQIQQTLFKSGAPLEGLKMQQQGVKSAADSKQQDFMNLISASKTTFKKVLSGGNVSDINSYIQKIQEAHPEYEDLFLKIPEGTQLGTTGNGEDIVTVPIPIYEEGKVIGKKIAAFTKQELIQKTKADSSPEGFTESTQQVEERDSRMFMRTIGSKKELADRSQTAQKFTIGEGDNAIDIIVNPKSEKQIPGEVKASKEAALPFEIEKEERQIKITKAKELRSVVRSKEYRNISDGLDSIQSALDSIQKTPTIYRDFVNKKLGRGEAALFDTALKNANDVITRIRTGAALNEQEIKFYDRLFAPGWFNDPKTAVKKMQILEELFIENKRRQLFPESELKTNTVMELAKQYGIAGEAEAPKVSADVINAFKKFKGGK